MNMEATTLRTRSKHKLVSLNSVVGSMFLRRIHVKDNHFLGGNHERFIDE